MRIPRKSSPRGGSRGPWTKRPARLPPAQVGSWLNRRRPHWLRRGVRHVLFAILLVAAALFIRETQQPPEPLSEVDLRFTLCGEGRGSVACVIDGDTVAIGPRRVRLTGYDAPELDGACEAERKNALAARLALHRWLAEGRFSWTGGSQPPRDRYGRELREARRGEELLAEAMVGAGLAEGSGWGAQRREWCA